MSRVAWIDVVPDEQASGKLREVYEHIRVTRGRIANVLRVHSIDPAVLRTHVDLYLAIMFGHGGLSRREREMIAVAVSAANRCQYCVTHHSAALAKYVVNGQFIRQLQQDYRRLPLTQREQAMLEYAVRLTRDPQAVSEADLQRLHSLGFSDLDVHAIVAVTAYFNFVNRIVEALGVQLEPDEGRGYRY